MLLISGKLRSDVWPFLRPRRLEFIMGMLLGI
jgi:hypothetical protein